MSLRTKFDGIRQMWQFDNRFELLLARALFSRKTLITYKYRGLEFLTDHGAGDANGARELLTTDMYRPFLRQMELPAKINVLDIGANNGGFPLLLMSEGFQFKKLACVELNPNTFSRMLSNIERNTDCEFNPLNVAVCGENTMLEVTLGKGSVGDNIYNRGSDDEEFRIDGQTFDAIYQDIFRDEQVDLCKIDVEGAEFDIFRSGTFQALKNCRYLLMEIHHEQTRNQDRQEIINMLKAIDFHEVDGDKKTDNFHHVHFFGNTKPLMERR